MSICYYCIDIYKYLALIFNFGDLMISVLFSFGVVFFIGSNYLVTYIWENYGFDWSLMGLNALNFFNLFGIVFS